MKTVLALAALAIVSASLPVEAQMEVNGWKVLACTLEVPESMRGVPLTIWFAENGQVFWNGQTLSGNVSSAEVAFSYKDVNWKISRITGRFAMIGKGASTATGTCVSAAAPKF